MVHGSQCVQYRIDADDRIVFLGGEWDEFARANQAADLSGDKVLNRSLFDFISGTSARYATEELLRGVRDKGIPISIPFRCDSPTLRRYMQMLITPSGEGQLVFNSCVVREEAREAVRLLDRDTDRCNRFVTVCSWCKDVQIDDEQWLAMEDAVRIWDFFSDDTQPQITHGMCPACYQRVLNETRS